MKNKICKKIKIWLLEFRYLTLRHRKLYRSLEELDESKIYNI